MSWKCVLNGERSDCTAKKLRDKREELIENLWNERVSREDMLRVANMLR